MRCSILILLATIDTVVNAQEATRPVVSPLAVRQQHVQQLVDELERKLVAVKLALGQSEPARAERLQAALNRSKELLLQQRMAEVAGQLNQAQLDAAEAGQLALLADIRQVLGVLLAEANSRESPGAEIERLGEWQQQIEQMANAERNLQQEVQSLSAKATKTDFEKLAQSQSNLAQEAAALRGQMAAQRNAPGQQSVSAAEQAMQAAAQSLTDQQVAQAGRQQGDAIRDLLSALKEIDDRARELRQQEQAETLGKLAGHFRQMLAQQQKLTAKTIELNTKRQLAAGQLSRLERNTARTIGEAERGLEPADNAPDPRAPGLAGQARQASEMLGDGGNSILLSLIEQLKEDLVQVGGWIAESLRTDEQTTNRQRAIESTLDQLAESLEQAKQSPASDQESEAENAAAAASGKKARLPASAELKLLRAAQSQVNRRTIELDRMRGQPEAAADAIQAEIRSVARRQAQLVELTKEISERLAK